MGESARRAAAALAAAIPVLVAGIATVHLAALRSVVSAGRGLGLPADEADDVWGAGLRDVVWSCGPLLLVALPAVLFARRLWRGSAGARVALACLAIPTLVAWYFAWHTDLVADALHTLPTDRWAVWVTSDVDDPGWYGPALTASLWAVAAVQLSVVGLLRPWELLDRAAEPRLDPARAHRGSWLLAAAAGLGLGLLGLYWAALRITEVRVQHLAEAHDLHYGGYVLLVAGAPLAVVCLGVLGFALQARRGPRWVAAWVWPLNVLMLLAAVLVGSLHPLKLEVIDEDADYGDDYGPVLDAVPGWYGPARIALSLAAVAACSLAAMTLRKGRATG